MRICLTIAVLLLACGPDPTQTDDEFTIDHDELQPIEACAECHPRQVEEYAQSTMAFSAFSPVVHALDLAFAELHADPFTDANLCGQCHAPAAHLRGLRSDGRSVLRDGFGDATTDGITCDVCHRVTAVTGEHTMALDIAPGAQKIGPIPDPIATRFHGAKAEGFMTESSLCGACHDVRLPIADAETGEADGRVENLFTEWKASPWADADHPKNPFRGVAGIGDLHPVDAGAQVTCQDCHMSLYPARGIADAIGLDAFPGVDPATLSRKAHKLYPTAQAAEVEGAPNRRVSTHAFFGASKPVVPFPRAEAAYDPAPLSDALLGPQPADPTQRDVWLAARAESTVDATNAGRINMLRAALRLSFAELPAMIAAEETLRIDAWVENVGAGHHVPAGFSQEREVWVELTVRDQGRPCVEDAECADLIERPRFMDPHAQCRVTTPSGAIEPPVDQGYDRWMRHERSGVCEAARCVIYRSGYLRDQDGDGRVADDDLRDALVEIEPGTLTEACALPGPDADLRLSGVNKGLVSFTNEFQRVAVDEAGAPIPDPQAERWLRPEVPPDHPEFATQSARFERVRYEGVEPGAPTKILDPLRANRFFNDNALRPFTPRLARYDVDVPASAVGPLQIEARVRFRFLPPRLLRALAAREALADRAPLITEALIDGALDVVDMAATQAEIELR